MSSIPTAQQRYHSRASQKLTQVLVRYQNLRLLKKNIVQGEISIQEDLFEHSIELPVTVEDETSILQSAYNLGKNTLHESVYSISNSVGSTVGNASKSISKELAPRVQC